MLYNANRVMGIANHVVMRKKKKGLSQSPKFSGFPDV